nr:MAG TPA: hypothetical protein [Caudoviricetes sp.]
MERYLIIHRKDSKDVRLNKKRFRKRLKRKEKKYTEGVFKNIYGHLSEINLLLSKNQTESNKYHAPKTRCKITDSDFSLYNCAGKVINVVLNILNTPSKGSFSLDFNNAQIGFGALYFIDIMGWYKSKEESWKLYFDNLSKEQTELFLNLRTDKNNEKENGNLHVINKHIKIERREEQILFTKEYEKGSKEIRSLVQKGIAEMTGNEKYELSKETHSAIHSVISEQFDNIYQHAINTKHADLCGMFDKRTNTVSILIFNFGPTIADTLKGNQLPLHVRQYKDNLINTYKQKGFFNLSQSFSEENALTLLALQEGISSKLDADETRGYGLMDFIEHCFELSIGTKIVIIPGQTTIRIDENYKIQKKEILGRERRVLSFNKEGDILNKPDKNYVLDHGAFFPGVIIETTIPLS